MTEGDLQLKNFLKIVGVLLVAAVLVVGGKLLFFPAHVADKVIDTATGIVDETLNAGNAIYNYEYFKQQYQSFVAINEKITQAEQAVVNYQKNLPSNRDKWSKADRDELSRLQTVADSLKYQRADIVADYNAKSQMANRAIFKDNNLPDTLKIPQ